MSLFDFNKVAGDYDLFYDTELGDKIDKFEKQAVSGFLKAMKGRNMLELGAGTGHWTALFSHYGFEVTGIDEAEEMLEMAARKNIPNAAFRKADAHNLPFEEDRFENVAMMATLEFVEDLGKVWDEIARVLQPGGSLLIGALNDRSSTAQNREENPVFGPARFLTYEHLQTELQLFGSPELKGCAYLPFADQMLPLAEIMEYDVSQSVLNMYGNFIAGHVSHEIQN